MLDRAALDALYRRLERRVYNVVFRWVWSAEDAREIVQESFVRLWDMRARVRMETVEPLLYQIAISQASKRRRWTRRWGWLRSNDTERPAELLPADDALGISAEATALRKAVDALPETERAVIMLVAFSELTYEDVGRTLGIAPGTVGSRRHSALARLRAALKERHV